MTEKQNYLAKETSDLDNERSAAWIRIHLGADPGSPDPGRPTPDRPRIDATFVGQPALSSLP